MRPPLFIKLVLFSGLLSSAILFFALRWSSPPVSKGNVEPQLKTNRSVPLNDDERNNVEIYERASSGVVNVTSTTIEYDFFFEPVPRQGIGSGSVIDLQGRVLTNSHVIEGADKLEVTLSDKTKYPARVIGMDPVADVAILQISAPRTKLHPIPFSATGEIRVGQKVLAIGNPFGLEQTLTTGIVSAINRSIRTESGMLMNDLIQTDAAINPGNSGGPLLNAAGEMIGINTTIFSVRGGGNIGIGFAVGVKTLNRLVPQLVSHGRVVRPVIGVRGQPVFPDLAELLRLPTDRGVMIISVEPNSTADISGLKGGDRRVRLGNLVLLVGGDIVTQIDGREVNSVQEIDEVLKDRNPGDKAAATVYRDGQRRKMTLTLAEKHGRRGILRF